MTTLSCDAFPCLYLLSFGLLFVGAKWMRDKACFPAGVIERADGRLPGRPDRIADRVHGGLTETERRGGPPCVRESDINRLEGYARQFDQAIENIRLGRQDFSRGK
jgi:hypothetical protein